MSWRIGILVALILAAAPLAGAQSGDDPTLSEDEFDTSPPPADESYLDDDADTTAGTSGGSTSGDDPATGTDDGTSTDASGDDPTLGEGDFDTSPPPADESYLDDEEDLAGTGAEDADDSGAAPAGTDSREGSSKVPAPAVGLLFVASIGAAALVGRRR